MLEMWVVKHWMPLFWGCLLTGLLIPAAYVERGYAAVGVEWLIIPMAFVVECFYRKAVKKLERMRRQHRRSRRR